jgi:hypothetical protein
MANSAYIKWKEKADEDHRTELNNLLFAYYNSYNGIKIKVEAKTEEKQRLHLPLQRIP